MVEVTIPTKKDSVANISPPTSYSWTKNLLIPFPSAPPSRPKTNPTPENHFLMTSIYVLTYRVLPPATLLPFTAKTFHHSLRDTGWKISLFDSASSRNHGMVVKSQYVAM